MDDLKTLQDALYSIKPSDLTYEEWLNVGMALKDEGLPCDLWDDWSRSDTRYENGICSKKWDSFEGSGVGVGTIFHYAETYGHWTRSRDLDWDDGIAESDFYREVLTNEKKEEENWQMTIRYLQTLFKPDDPVSYVHSAEFKEDRQKWNPANGGCVRKCKDIIRDLKKTHDYELSFGTLNPDAGAWIRINPTTGPNDNDVIRYAYALVESDTLPIEEQKKILINSHLPIAALVESGGKSVHAVVRIDAANKFEFDQRVNFTFDWLMKRNFVVDENNKNEARLSRLPGVMRKGKLQKLIATNIGCTSWLDWRDYCANVEDTLPPLSNFWEQCQNPPELSPELIAGVLREGNKMIITGESKAGKTCLSQNLAACIAEGKPWLGKFQCQQGKVLYINLEVEEASLFYRFKEMYKAQQWPITETCASNIIPWNLRGHAIPLEKLADQIVARCRATGPYKAIILDPLYKVQQGDENSAEAIIAFCNALDKIAHETGAAVIYDHHHPKGAVGSRKVIDRGSGSGVFSRDADAICDLSFLDPSAEILQTVGQQIAEGEKPMQIAFVLRDFKDIEPINLWFKFPLHFMDTAGLLEGAAVEGSAEANLQKTSKRTTAADRAMILEEGFFACEEHGIAKLNEIVEFFGGKPSEKTLRRYIEESDQFKVEKGYVSRASEDSDK